MPYKFSENADNKIKKGMMTMSAAFESSRTRENLIRAFAGESQARNRYDMAAEYAKQKGYYFLYNIFTLTANQEKAHAKIFYDHMKQLGESSCLIPQAEYPVYSTEDIEKLLRFAQHNEYEEYEKVYPAFAETAREEGFAQIAYSFEKIAAAEKVHGDRFGCFAELMERSALFSGNESTEWICLNCGHIFKGAKVPERCPVCSVSCGYFVPYKYYCFIASRYGEAFQF